MIYWLILGGVVLTSGIQEKIKSPGKAVIKGLKLTWSFGVWDFNSFVVKFPS